MLIRLRCSSQEPEEETSGFPVVPSGSLQRNLVRDHLTVLNRLNFRLHPGPAARSLDVGHLRSAGIIKTGGFTTVTMETMRQRSDSVEVNLSKGTAWGGVLVDAHHVLQKLPARLARVNKPPAKVTETQKVDFMQTGISTDPAEPHREQQNVSHLKENHGKNAGRQDSEHANPFPGFFRATTVRRLLSDKRPVNVPG